ncbi:hypothetical protein BDP27DRAFT_1310237 [Rhodocollybia butyracea]|uniref:LysM domain-containing protein n=1 Tax=Rhodocollybia butyracea TaxID=206335 RepID=A0A9P5UFZ6_9AGAR|nr:hypothetical protein BDP27DRAFT_1310237 [Rhodocollybia butyracea]
MSRWSQYDEDSYRLPEGVQRIGYDADTGRYIFSSGGSTLQGPQGARYGEMTRVSGSEAQNDDEEAPTRADGYQPLATDNNSPLAFRSDVNSNAYRTLAPFFLLIGVFLLLVWKLIYSGYKTAPNPCPEHATIPYMVEPGDECWGIAHTYKCSLEELELLNPNVCGAGLRPGMVVCVPQPTPPSTPSDS